MKLTLLTGAAAAALMATLLGSGTAQAAPVDVSPVAVGATNARNAVHAFVRGTDGHVYAKSGDRSAPWRKLPGGAVASGPTATTDADDLIHLFARGVQNAVMWNRETAPGVWSGWETIGGVATSAPDAMVVNLAVDKLIVVVRGTDGAYYVKVRNGAEWGGWQKLGGQWTSAPALTGAGEVGPGWEIGVYGRGTTGDEYSHQFSEARFATTTAWVRSPREDGLASAYGTGSETYENSPGTNTTGPWYVTSAGNLHGHHWNDPDPPAKKLTSAPATALAGGDVEPPNPYWEIVFARGTDGALWALPANVSAPPGRPFGAWESWGGQLR